jgi:uncharacterized membrane protein YjjP (DUF1212 family)
VALKDLQLNSERYLERAFDPQQRAGLLRAALLRRNVYIVLFFIGIICIFIAGFSGWTDLSVLSLFLALLSLVVVSKYDTQIFFLKIIEQKALREE